MTVGMGRTFNAVCLTCLSVCLQHSSKTKDPKVFKLDLWISYKWCDFVVERLGLGLTAILHGFELLSVFCDLDS